MKSKTVRVRMIAEHTKGTTHGRWTAFPDQASATIALYRIHIRLSELYAGDLPDSGFWRALSSEDTESETMGAISKNTLLVHAKDHTSVINLANLVAVKTEVLSDNERRRRDESNRVAEGLRRQKEQGEG